ncbi:anti-sigma factor [Flavobacterium sp. CYK-55]|uniref:anti-sigma factor n=1 Tax=Flavobacterium sp. CYK-55 TaxID=2835529 RepID=UPI001BCCD58E|nr:anti-sigma factor [Flavobacterium sp. CYK-55]MBS7786692.1 anti-sigma factor [Flavobacterium sp. CYK-55]
MSTSEYISSGILEFYVYGLLSESENETIAQLAKENTEVQQEIIEIENAIIDLSSSFSPVLSLKNFEAIKEKLALKQGKTIALKPDSNKSKYWGWAAAAVLLLTSGLQYMRINETQFDMANIENEKIKLQESLVNSEIKNQQTEDKLSVLMDANNSVVSLVGQTVAPKAFAKVYYNKNTQTVYVDATGLPEPPEGKVYQVWALKLNPLTPTSIGLLADFKGDDHKLFAVDKASGAEAFGITLEPAGGSKSPTLEQLYTLGKV